MLPIALQVGINVIGYWYMTYGEIVDTIEAYNENERNRTREVASFNYSLANLIGLSVARLMDDKAKFPSLQEAFPEMFDDIKYEEKQLTQQDPDIMKARFMEFAESHNKKKH